MVTRCMNFLVDRFNDGRSCQTSERGGKDFKSSVRSVFMNKVARIVRYILVSRDNSQFILLTEGKKPLASDPANQPASTALSREWPESSAIFARNTIKRVGRSWYERFFGHALHHHTSHHIHSQLFLSSLLCHLVQFVLISKFVIAKSNTQRCKNILYCV